MGFTVGMLEGIKIKTMKSKYNFTQVYCVWVNGRSIEDVDQHYPIESNLSFVTNRDWHTDFNQATKDYFKAKAVIEEFTTETYKDYVVQLFMIDIDVNKFEIETELEFDINDDKVQEMIPYHKDYDFVTVAERIVSFGQKCCNLDCTDNVHKENSVYCEFHASM